MSGEEVMRELQRVGSTTPIILSSGYDSQELGQRLVGRGVSAILQKPYGMDELRATAFQVVTQRSPS
jgi:two-component system, cell cycle sensor histidine kinase and response regulator CckA